MVPHKITTRVSTWLPIVTRCPLSIFPDFVYVYVTFDGFQELYEVRRALRKRFQWRKMFMENIAAEIMDLYPNAIKVEVRILTGRHVAAAYREQTK